MAASSKKSGFLFLGFALAIGLIAGVITVYGTGGFDGNGENAQKTAELIAQCTLSEATRASLDAAATGDLAAMRIATKPVPLSHVGFQLPDGTQTSFADWKDKVVLLNIWATWCGPCREEMPDLAKLEETYGSDKFEVVALNVDRNGGNKPKAFLESIQATALKLYLDPANKSFQDLRAQGLVFGLPTTMLLDSKGCVQGVLAGIAHWGSDDAKNLVEVAMKELGDKS